MKASTKGSLLEYFDQAAPHYSQVEPAFAPLVDELIALADVKAHERVLDAGTGSGLALRGCEPLSRAFGVDFSQTMLKIASRYVPGRLFRADLHNLAVGSGLFDVVLASFALNSTDPALSVCEICRVLTPGGRLVIQEWGAPDPLSELVSDTVAGYSVDEPPPALAAMRTVMDAAVPWDGLDGPDDIAALIEDTGFSSVKMTLEQPLVRLPDIETFIRYKLAWPNRRAEIDAMPAEARGLCLSDLRENLATHAEVDGSLSWRPEVIRICAHKPAS